ncbi:alpha/beta hydrolase [Paenibacillus radicis (ex Gao et al. 2016)]|uniref:Alpha/beta hydrolase n=1 Tax=Paenibacillus radicis (ex Gao et al. 2016) TaxID=1737354 RepID=A0A917HGL6_9BACL|nr:alpha/beta fold hydrolase [Paenibacillus radicis (ex Gao et al. 2016)]GGG78540.1 alpha/beta hydrolase [Paenibacillus radicis (ex Gao et al. 2016)]
MEKQLILRHDGLELAATLHYPKDGAGKENAKKQAIIISHGFVGSRVGVDRLFVKTARALAAEGSYVLRFDYGGCGESNGDYGALGFESMIDQTRTAIDYISSMDCVDPQRIVLLGHSLGGAIALMTAVRDRRVKRLILWSPVAYPFNDIVRIVGRAGYDEAVQQGDTDYSGFTLQPVFFDSLLQHQPFQAATKFGGEVLLVHGTSDELIPVDYSFLYQKVFWTRSEGLCDKEIIFQANHTYSNRKHQEEAIRVSSNWLAGLDRQHQEWHHWSI